MFVLVFQQDGQIQRYSLQKGHVLLGRSRRCDVVLTDPSVSGRHAEIEVGSDGVILRDLNSSNGTTVAGERIAECKLESGAGFRLGRVTFQLEGPAGSTAQGTAAFSATPAPGAMETPPAGVAAVTPGALNAVPAADAAVSGPSPMPTPAALMPLSASQAEGSPAELVPLADVSGPAAANDPAAGRKKIIRLGAVACLALAGVIVIAGQLLKPKGPSTPRAVAYGNVQYENDLIAGQEAFLKSPPAYGRAKECWVAADQGWRGNRVNRRRRTIARSLAEVATELARAQKSSGYEKVKWAQLAQTFGDLYQDGDYPDDMERFLMKQRTWALAQAGELAQLEKGRKTLQSGEFAAGIEILAEIPENSLFYAQARKAMKDGQKARQSDELKAVRELAQNQEYAQALHAAEAYLKRYADLKLEADCKVWQAELQESQWMREAKEAAQQGKLEGLQRARTLYQRIPTGSSRHAEAARQLAALAQRELTLQVAALYQSGDAAGLQALAARHPELKTQSQFRQLAGRMKSVTTLFERAKKLVEQKNYFGARTQWEDITRLEPERTHPYNRRARALLRDYSLEKIGREWLSQARSLAGKPWKAGSYRQARELVSRVREKCGLDVREDEEVFRNRAQELYRQAQMKFNLKQVHGGLELLTQALECLVPSDENYERYARYKRQKEGANP